MALTKTEHAKLIEKYGSKATEKAIEKIGLYKGASGRKYKSDYMAILSWVMDSIDAHPLSKSSMSEAPEQDAKTLEMKRILNGRH